MIDKNDISHFITAFGLVIYYENVSIRRELREYRVPRSFEISQTDISMKRGDKQSLNDGNVTLWLSDILLCVCARAAII